MNHIYNSEHHASEAEYNREHSRKRPLIEYQETCPDKRSKQHDYSPSFQTSRYPPSYSNSPSPGPSSSPSYYLSPVSTPDRSSAEGLLHNGDTHYGPYRASSPFRIQRSPLHAPYPNLVFEDECRIEKMDLDTPGHIEDSGKDAEMHEAGAHHQEICFGMIKNAGIISSITNMHHRPAMSKNIGGKRKKQASSPAYPVVVRPQGLFTTVHRDSGEYIGLLDSQSSKGIRQLLELPSVRLQAFLSDPKETRDCTSNQPKPSILVCINLYGPSHITDGVGNILSNNEIYLQHPKYHEKRLKYENPHYFIGADERINTAAVPFVDRFKDEIKGLFEMSLNSSLPEAVDLGNGVSTPLLSHQKKAVYFMQQKERDQVLGTEHNFPVSIWELERARDGPISYVNSITKEITLTKPQSVRGGVLADGMGLGKSLTTLSLITSTMDEAKKFGMNLVAPDKLQAKTTLIVAPASILNSWKEQINMHIKPGVLKVHIYHGCQKEADPAKLINFDIVMTTYSTIRSEVFSKRSSNLRNIKWFRIVLDEAHVIREQSTQQSMAICLLEAQRRWCLTGTPIQNKLHDFGTLLKFLRVSPFDKAAYFSQHIIKPLKTADPHGLGKLRRLIGSVCLRRTKNILDLPPRTDQIQYVYFEPRDRYLYDACKKDSTMMIEHALTGNIPGRAYFGILQSILRLRLFCDHGEVLLPVEVAFRLPEYLSLHLPGTTSSSSSLYSDTVLLASDPLLETCSVECGMCNDSLGPEEVETGTFAECSHTICNRCSAIPKSYMPPLRAAEPFCPICAKKEEYCPYTTELTGLSWTENRFYSGPSSKVKALVENLQKSTKEDLREPTKSVVFSCWTKMLDLIGLALTAENMKFSRFDGSLSLRQRKESVDAFRENSHMNILLVSIGSGGFGLNLTAASRVHLMEPQWNPMVEQQALDRLHRIGQKKEVITTRYIVKHSIEESILAFQKRKLALADLSLSQKPLKENKHSSYEYLKELQALFK